MTLTKKWARGILKLLDRVKRDGTTAKREMNPALYEEHTFTWKRKIYKINKLNPQTQLGFLHQTKQPSLEKVPNQCQLPMSMRSTK